MSRILTFGGRGTNWGLATALYARAIGIETVLALVDQPMTPHVVEQFERIRNSGARVVLTRGKRRTVARAPWLWLSNGRPLTLPAGGSTPLGAVGYVAAGLEIGGQVRRGELPEPDWIVTAVGTGGTLAGPRRRPAGSRPEHAPLRRRRQRQAAAHASPHRQAGPPLREARRT